MTPLTLVDFSLPHDRESAVERLTSLDYLVDVQDGIEWLTGERSKEIAMLLIGRRDYPRSELLSALNSVPHPVTICAFAHDPVAWDRDVCACCFDFVRWPCDQEELAARLQHLYVMVSPVPQSSEDVGCLDVFLMLNLVGKAPSFLQTLELIRKVAKCDAPVLIEGETGVGKELAARAIHYFSARRDHPFVPINCGALPDNLAENELFGHARGAYTDAKGTQPGLIAQAEGGTLFLDEVDSLSAKVQVSLLRFLQDKLYRPLGGNLVRNADVRVITATNRHIETLVAGGLFRRDLFFRINLLTIRIPPLRERPGDAELIAESLMNVYRRQYKQHDKFFHPGSLAWMDAYHWPGNVRELENLVHKEFLLADSRAVRIAMPKQFGAPMDDLHFDVLTNETIGGSLIEAKSSMVRNFEKAYLRKVLAQTKGNVTQAAKQAGKERRAFGKLLQKYGIKRDQFLEM